VGGNNCSQMCLWAALFWVLTYFLLGSGFLHLSLENWRAHMSG
jgi:hypothetical protein